MLFRRQHAGPGFSYVTDETVELSGWKIIRVMLKHIWPRDKPSLKARVVIAVGLLFAAKVPMMLHYCAHVLIYFTICSVGECPDSILL